MEKKVILIVEDDPTVGESLRHLLKKKGHEILLASNGKEALQLFRHEVVDLVITDVVMPEMNGRDLAERMQAFYPGMKILFMSGHSDETLAHYGVLEPDVAFLPKPFGPLVLANKVREVLDES